MRLLIILSLILSSVCQADVISSLNQLKASVPQLEQKMSDEFRNRIEQYFVMNFIDRLAGIRSLRSTNVSSIDNFYSERDSLTALLDTLKTDYEVGLNNIVMIDNKMSDLGHDLDSYSSNLKDIKRITESLKIKNCIYSGQNDDPRIARAFKEFTPSQVGGYLQYFPAAISQNSTRAWSPFNATNNLGTDESQILRTSLAILDYPLAATFDFVVNFLGGDHSNEEAKVSNQLIKMLNEMLARLESDSARVNLIKDACDLYNNSFLRPEIMKKYDEIVSYAKENGIGDARFKDMKRAYQDHLFRYAEMSDAMGNLKNEVTVRLLKMETDRGEFLRKYESSLTQKFQKSNQYVTTKVRKLSTDRQDSLNAEIDKRKARRRTLLAGDLAFPKTETTTAYKIYQSSRDAALNDLIPEDL